jgi:ribA/ribD-fused uncharacterized protein
LKRETKLLLLRAFVSFYSFSFDKVLFEMFPNFGNQQLQAQAQPVFSAMPVVAQPVQIQQQAPVVAQYVPRPQGVVLFNNANQVNGYLSPKIYSPFVSASGKDFLSVSHYLAYRKAQEAGDMETAERILAVKIDHDSSNELLQSQALGAIEALIPQIKGANEEKWQGVLDRYLKEAIVYKFAQQPEMLKALMYTENDYLVYANPEDRVLGIGFDAAAAANPATIPQWGKNLLGNSLQAVRNGFRNEGIPQWAYGGDKPSSKRKEEAPIAADSKPDTGAVDIAALLNASIPVTTPAIDVAPSVLPTPEPPAVITLPSTDGVKIDLCETESSDDE